MRLLREKYPAPGCCGDFLLEDTVLSLTSDAEGSARKLAKGQSSVTSDAILAAVLTSLEDDKAEDVVQIDLRGISEIGDHMVICSGRSTRQVAAISEKLKSRLKDDLGILSRSKAKTRAIGCLWIRAM